MCIYLAPAIKGRVLRDEGDLTLIHRQMWMLQLNDHRNVSTAFGIMWLLVIVAF